MMLILVLLAVIASAEKGKAPAMEPDCVVIGEIFSTMSTNCLEMLFGNEMNAPMPAAACSGPCLQFMMNQERWRKEIQWCFDKAAGETVDLVSATRIRTTPITTQRIINFGCSVNHMGNFCANPLNATAPPMDPNATAPPMDPNATAPPMDPNATAPGPNPLERISNLECPTNQTVVDEEINMVGCCFASFAEILRQQAAWNLAPSCPQFKTGKPCKTAKWKIPKMTPSGSKMGKGKKVGLAIGLAAGCLAGAAVVGLALRRRKTKQVRAAPASKTSGTTGTAQPVVLSV
jgi:hypothetical protein